MKKNKRNFSFVSGALANKCLVAMPSVEDDYFTSSVVYVCSHSEKDGATGLVLNKTSTLNFLDIAKQLGAAISDPMQNVPSILFGGPVEPARGFFLHSSEYQGFETTSLTDYLNLTISIDIVSSIAQEKGPKDYLFMVGYSSWEPGQLELEIAGNDWLVMDPSPEFIFDCPARFKWRQALLSLGIDPLMLSLEQGSV